MTLVETEIQFLSDAIAKRSGNVISVGQGYLLEARLKPIAELAGLKDTAELVQELRKNPSSPLHDQVTEAMTINETSFFRDMQPFDALRGQIIPELMAKREPTKSISVWSAASSSGQEPYSVAFALRSSFPELQNWNVRILGTDYSNEMVQRTRDAVYSQFEVNRGLPAKMLIDYFDRKGLNWRVKPDIRRMVDCKRLNLTESWPTILKYDIVFLRNVLIYFDNPTKEGILQKIHASMRPDGFLFLGGGETLIQLNVPFEPVTVGRTVAFRPVERGGK